MALLQIAFAREFISLKTCISQSYKADIHISLIFKPTDCPGAFESFWEGYYLGVGGYTEQFGGIF